MTNLEQKLLDRINKELEDYKKEIANLDNESFISRAEEINEITSWSWFWADGIRSGMMLLSEDYILGLLDQENLIEYINFVVNLEELSEENVALQWKLRDEYLDFKEKVAMLSIEEKIDKSFLIGLFKKTYDETMEQLRNDETDEEFIKEALKIDNVIFTLVASNTTLDDFMIDDLAEILGIEVED